MSSTTSTKVVMVVNCGSSSLKYEVYRMPEGTSLGKGLVERIGLPMGKLEQNSAKGDFHIEQAIPDHTAAMNLVQQALLDPAKGILGSLGEVAAVGHRVVHGGEKYSQSVIIDDKVMAAITECVELAPLHNPANLTGIRESQRLFPQAKQVAVFDTAFHQTMPAASYLYGLPRELYEKHRIRKYGFHGTSHRFVYQEAVKFMKRSPENTNVITVHLGNGASVTAIEKGKSVDTSMGFTPLEGLVMGTRCGDMDPQIIFWLLKHGYTTDQVETMLNKKSGLMGMTNGLSSDMRDIRKAAEEGNQLAIDAIEVFAKRVRRYIGSYMAELEKVDAIVFTGGIGQWATIMRERICRGLENLGVSMDYELNNKTLNKLAYISHGYSNTALLVVPTNEELQIATDAYQLVYEGGIATRASSGD
jgi:acetate kinase